MYKRVAILGVDGAGSFFSQTDTPCMDQLFAGGAVTYDALTSIPTISAECWGSMLLGVEPTLHGLTNEIVSTQPYDVASPYPSVFRVAHAALPGARLASFCNWNPINGGIIEENLGVKKGTAGNDAAVCDLVLTYLEQNDPTLLFVQFDEVDGAGHKFGYGAPLHLKKITEIDALIGKIVATYRAKGYAEDTLFIVSADHGGNPLHGHGGDSDAEKLIFIGCAGHSVKPGVIAGMNVRDIAAVTAAALGLEAPETWTAKVPDLLK
ncbi:MAG: alkaline phosphatase family protein [Oscillospiraceae bacterium]|jgi:predicted AlkP superfamily pyrophosphatase or phosphodiesterase|nr:alkaline phosphatase family protein [Oscillospiraceae bacterium]